MITQSAQLDGGRRFLDGTDVGFVRALASRERARYQHENDDQASKIHGLVDFRQFGVYGRWDSEFGPEM